MCLHFSSQGRYNDLFFQIQIPMTLSDADMYNTNVYNIYWFVQIVRI